MTFKIWFCLYLSFPLISRYFVYLCFHFVSDYEYKCAHLNWGQSWWEQFRRNRIVVRATTVKFPFVYCFCCVFFCERMSSDRFHGNIFERCLRNYLKLKEALVNGVHTGDKCLKKHQLWISHHRAKDGPSRNAYGIVVRCRHHPDKWLGVKEMKDVKIVE